MMDKLLWLSSLPMNFSLPARHCESHPAISHQPKDIFIHHSKEYVFLLKLEGKENNMRHSAQIWLKNRTNSVLKLSVTPLRYSESKLMAKMTTQKHTYFYGCWNTEFPKWLSRFLFPCLCLWISTFRSPDCHCFRVEM